jgi:hypothetical protein
MRPHAWLDWPRRHAAHACANDAPAVLQKAGVLVLRDHDLFRQLWPDLGWAVRHSAAKYHELPPTSPRNPTRGGMGHVCRPRFGMARSVLDSGAVRGGPAQRRAASIVVLPARHVLWRHLRRVDPAGGDRVCGRGFSVPRRTGRPGLHLGRVEPHRDRAVRDVHRRGNSVRMDHLIRSGLWLFPAKNAAALDPSRICRLCAVLDPSSGRPDSMVWTVDGEDRGGVRPALPSLLSGLGTLHRRGHCRRALVGPITFSKHRGGIISDDCCGPRNCSFNREIRC